MLYSRAIAGVTSRLGQLASSAGQWNYGCWTKCVWYVERSQVEDTTDGLMR